MALHHYRNPITTLTCLLAMTTLSGCSGFGGDLVESRQQINITSDPDDATVLAEGMEIGKTPLAIRPGDVFQARFTSGSPEDGIFSFRYAGTLALKKPGCEPYSTQVNDNILSKDIHVRLECDPDYQPSVAQPAAPAPATSAPAQPAATVPVKPAAAPSESLPTQPTGSAEERLLRIESLHQKGLLSDEEYRTLRQRVLDTL